MTLFDSPRDVMSHLKELESHLNPTGYDHQEGEMTGWRAERRLERIRESEAVNRPVESKLDLCELQPVPFTFVHSSDISLHAR